MFNPVKDKPRLCSNTSFTQKYFYLSHFSNSNVEFFCFLKKREKRENFLYKKREFYNNKKREKREKKIQLDIIC